MDKDSVVCWRCGGTDLQAILANETWRCLNPECQAITVTRLPSDFVPADLSQTGPNA